METIQLFLYGVFKQHGNIAVDKFAHLYGVHLCTAAILFHFAVSVNQDVVPLHVLYFLDWIRQCPTREVAEQRWGACSKTIRKWSMVVLLALFETLDTVWV